MPFDCWTAPHLWHVGPETGVPHFQQVAIAIFKKSFQRDCAITLFRDEGHIS
jgi:hypothetical protein